MIFGFDMSRTEKITAIDVQKKSFRVISVDRYAKKSFFSKDVT